MATLLALEKRVANLEAFREKLMKALKLYEEETLGTLERLEKDADDNRR